MLVVDVLRRQGAFELRAQLAAAAGATTVLVGESGAGKTTLLRLLAGLDRPDQGRITVDDVVYVDTGAGVWLPPWQRELGYVPQDFALFPHLSVFENVAFGLRSLGLGADAIRRRGEEALRTTGIPELGSRRPTQLSGGQQQRVALARALVLEPRLLLLDEPLSALDLQTRRVIRTELRALLRRLPCITLYVTHSPLEALLFGDHIVVLDGGRVSQTGSRDELLRHPRSAYVAELLGTNLFVGMRIDSDTSENVPLGEAVGGGNAPALVKTPEGVIVVTGQPDAGAVFVTVSPREITLYRELPEASAQNSFRGPILEIAPEPPRGERLRVVLGTTPVLVAEVTAKAVAALGLREGDVVYAGFKATGVTTYSEVPIDR